MPIILKSLAFRSPGGKRQPRVLAIQRLNGALLIHTKDSRVLRRVEVKANDIGAFDSNSGSWLAVYRSRRCGFIPRTHPDPLHGRLAQAQGSSHLAARPMRRALRRQVLQFLEDSRLYRSGGYSYPGSPITRNQPFDPLLFESLFPASNSRRAGLQLLGDHLIGLAIRQGQNQSSPENLSGTSNSRACNSLQVSSIFVRKMQNTLLGHTGLDAQHYNYDLSGTAH